MIPDPAILAALDKLIAAIRAYDDPRRASGEWKQVYRLLQKTPLPADRVGDVVGMRDAAGLAGLVEEFRNPPVAGAVPDAPSGDICAKALQAFRKRFSLTVLDEESKLGRNPLTKGAKSTVAGIIPPSEWPESVWQELVRQGKLRYLGRGFYEPVKP
ncbi:MAG: hypothetical protein ABSA67_12300 [Candidatus Brocadiia bacterium]|jgi:hypothetical protein